MQSKRFNTESLVTSCFLISSFNVGCTQDDPDLKRQNSLISPCLDLLSLWTNKDFTKSQRINLKMFEFTLGVNQK